MTGRLCIDCRDRETPTLHTHRCDECRQLHVNARMRARRKRISAQIAAVRGTPAEIRVRAAYRLPMPRSGACTSTTCPRRGTAHGHCQGDGTGRCGMPIPAGDQRCPMCRRDVEVREARGRERVLRRDPASRDASTPEGQELHRLIAVIDGRTARVA